MLLALMMTVCVFAACNKDEDASKDKDDKETTEATDKADDKESAETKKEKKTDKKADKKVNEEDAVEDVINAFVEAAFTGDDKALDYVDEDSDAYAETEERVEMYNQLGTLAESMGVPKEYAEDVNQIVEKIADAAYELVECDVTDVNVDGDEATADVKLSAPDFENIETIISGMDAEAIIMDNFTEEEILALENASEEEQAEFMIEVIEILFDEVVAELEANTVEAEVTFSLEKIDGEWLLVSYIF